MSTVINRLLDTSDLVGLPEKVEEILEYGQSRCIAYNPIGTLLASGCQNGEVVIWDNCTRGVARILEGHRAPVIFVGWSCSGREIVSVAADGQVIQWDVLSGSQTAVVHLGCQPGEEVCHACLDPCNDSQLLVSCLQGQARFLDLRTKEQTLLPALVLKSDRVAAHALLNPPGVVQLAVLSSCGRLVFGVTRGAMAVYRRTDLALLDLIALQNCQAVLSMFHSQGAARESWLLVVTQEAVRAYRVVEEAHLAEAHALRDLEGHRKPPKPGTSLLRGASGPLLQHKRQYAGQSEKKSWSCATISADMEHVAAGKSSQHVIQLWEQEHGLSEAVLESGGGGGGVVTMAWNPIPMPLQLCTVDASGRIRIWAKVQRENWTCFAPDFEELEENREYVEREDEFDLNPRPEDDDMSEEEMGDEEDLDILGDAGPGPASATPSGRVILNSLPVTVADINSALEREKLQAQQEAAAAARPCSAHGDGSNEKEPASKASESEMQAGFLRRQASSGGSDVRDGSLSEGGGKRKRRG